MIFRNKLVFVRIDMEKPARDTHTLDYYKHLLITAVKSFLTLYPGSNVIKLFIDIIYKHS
jgi:hypothetical protein